VLLFPELENGDLAATLPAASGSALSNFVARGGVMVVFSGHSETRAGGLLNKVFGFNVQERMWMRVQRQDSGSIWNGVFFCSRLAEDTGRSQCSAEGLTAGRKPEPV
jgi:hypothetical protein